MTKRILYCFISMFLVLGTFACSDQELVDKLNIDSSIKNESSNKNDSLKQQHGLENNQSLKLLQEDIIASESFVGAVAYLGYREMRETNTLTEWLKENCGDLVEMMPFILDIPHENIIGQGYGDLFCIVPADDRISLGVNYVKWESRNGEFVPIVENVLYRNEYAEPLLVFIEYDKSSINSNTMIVMVGNDGKEVIWLPYIDCYGYPNIPTDDDGLPLLMDFTIQDSQVDSGPQDYYCFGDDCSLPPTNLGLIDTNWIYDNWYIAFSWSEEGSYLGDVNIYYRKDVHQDYVLTFFGTWEMQEEYLVLDIFDTDGAYFGGTFPVLIDPSGEHLDIYRDPINKVNPPFFSENTPSLRLTLVYD